MKRSEINNPLFQIHPSCFFNAVMSHFILFLDKMVNTILSCESFAGRRWRREMYGLTFFAAAPLAAETAAE